jgi:DNA-binding LytR/AlgR family response regulator
MTKTDTWRRLAVETPEGTTLLFEPSQVFYLETEGHDTLVHTARKKPYRSTRRMADLLTRLPGPPFFRCHESFAVNLARVRSIETVGRDRRLRLDPPVNRLLPVARGRVASLHRALGL